MEKSVSRYLRCKATGNRAVQGSASKRQALRALETKNITNMQKISSRLSNWGEECTSVSLSTLLWVEAIGCGAASNEELCFTYYDTTNQG